ncbi:MAG TPA: sulfotransferase [Candidatus Binatia bacterium]|nr:sulfotransferase [Candidatus Binatia bacterium]
MPRTDGDPPSSPDPVTPADPATPTDPAVSAAAAALPEAIFVTGVSRSGTTLLRTVFESTSTVAIAQENHYLGHLFERWGARQRFARLGDPRDDATIRAIVDDLYSGAFQRRSRLREISPYWRWLLRTVPREEVERRLLASDRTDRGLFEAFLRLYADHHGKAVLGEKTPAHINYADELLEWFPGGRIVQMVRDPRGVYVSELRRRRERPSSVPYRQLRYVPPLFALFVLLQVTWAWARAIDRHRELSVRYPDRYRMVRFEDLVRDPQATLAGLFDVLGLPLEPQVFDRTVVSRGVNLGEQGFDATAADRWQHAISGRARRWLETTLRGRMRSVGYRQADPGHVGGDRPTSSAERTDLQR